MKTYFTADTHFAHEKVLTITDRDLHFASVEQHDDALIGGINSTVGEGDRLFILGDFAWRAGESFTKRIRCRNLHLIFGNHDRTNFGKLFKSVEDTAIVRIQGHKVFLSHYPHAYWPSSHRGSLHLYGHVHAEREETLDAAFPGRRSLDCGVDNAKLLLGEYRPFSEDEVISILMARPGHDQVEFYDQQRAARRDRVPAMLTNESILNHEAAEKFHEKLKEINDGKQPLPPTEVFYKKAMETSAEIKAESGMTAKELAHTLAEQFRKNGNYDT